MHTRYPPSASGSLGKRSRIGSQPRFGLCVKLPETIAAKESGLCTAGEQECPSVFVRDFNADRGQWVHANNRQRSKSGTEGQDQAAGGYRCKENRSREGGCLPLPEASPRRSNQTERSVAMTTRNAKRTTSQAKAGGFGRLLIAAVAGGALVLCAVFMLTGAIHAQDGNDNHGTNLRADLKGFAEVPSKSTPATGTFHATVSEDGSSIRYELSYSGLVADALFSHIHFGQKGVAGGIVVYLCSNVTTNPIPPFPTGIQPQSCPLRAGTITGTVMNADITTGASAQGISPGTGEFAKLIEAIRGGVAYVNVHSTTFPPGEIRGQIRVQEK